MSLSPRDRRRYPPLSRFASPASSLHRQSSCRNKQGFTFGDGAASLKNTTCHEEWEQQNQKGVSKFRYPVGGLGGRGSKHSQNPPNLSDFEPIPCKDFRDALCVKTSSARNPLAPRIPHQSLCRRTDHQEDSSWRDKSTHDLEKLSVAIGISRDVRKHDDIEAPERRPTFDGSSEELQVLSPPPRRTFTVVLSDFRVSVQAD